MPSKKIIIAPTIQRLLNNESTAVTITRTVKPGDEYARFNFDGTEKPKDIVRAFLAAALALTSSSLNNFSQRSGVPQATLSKLLNHGSRDHEGDGLVQIGTLIKIADACGLILGVMAMPCEGAATNKEHTISFDEKLASLEARAKAFGALFKAMRGSLSQDNYGALIGASRMSISHIESGHRGKVYSMPNLASIVQHQKAGYTISLRLHRPATQPAEKAKAHSATPA
ncbi:MAG: hypothetical protein EB059_05140 [Alphaproteobacteria bacterium]|nr:hypothetical protein [Alphaproteobacteria bacterium]